MTTLVSVIMPAKNAGKYIKKSIESIINQDYSNFELIIINDNSTDNTLEVINQFNDKRIHVLTGNGAGIADAFNLGLENAKGKFFCRCDSDDLYPLDRLTIQVDWLEKNPNYIAVCGMYSAIDNKGRHLVQYLREAASQNIDNYFRKGQTITHFCTFMTKTVELEKLGGCRPFFVTGEDIDLQLRLSELGSIFFLPVNVYFYRLHNFSITHTQPNATREFYEQLARDCHKQRLDGLKDKVDMRSDIIFPQIEDKPRTSDNKIINQMISESWYWHRKKNKGKAFFSALKIIRFFPLKLNVWRNVILVIFKA